MPANQPRRQPHFPSHHNNNEKNEKKEAENRAVQSKIYCDEAASHIKAGNYKKAMSGYNMVKIFQPGISK